MHGTISEKVYVNAGNPDVVAMIDGGARKILDVGCGAGANASLLRRREPSASIYGITASAAEAALAGKFMEHCWVADLEGPLPDPLRSLRFDTILLSHVLEHLKDPAELLLRLSEQLTPGGHCVIAVPNVLYWRERADFLRGRFEYRAHGTLDETHLRFFTYYSAPDYLLAKAPALRLVEQRATGSVPLWVLRRHVLPERVARRIDAWGCAAHPNLFGTQILLKARRV